MSIVLDALKKTSASEKISSTISKTPGGPPLRGAVSPLRRFVFFGAIGSVAAAGLGMILWFVLPQSPDPSGREGAPRKVGSFDARPDESPAVLHDEGAALLRAGNYAGALAKFSELASRRPDSPQAHNNLGLVLKKMGRREEAADRYRKALTLDPGHVEAMNNLAVLYKEQNKQGEAEALLLRALAKNPEYAEAHLNYALLLEWAGREGEARRHYQAYLRLTPLEDPTALRIRETLH